MTQKQNNELLDYLRTRRSVSLKNMGDQRPSDAEIEDILTIASRTPDHGKIVPWRFIVLKDEARAQMRPILREAYLKEQDSNACAERLEIEERRFERAPLVIIVISSPDEQAKHPVWEQELTTGAVCMNLSHATHAIGYGINWLSEWMAYSPTIHNHLKINAMEKIAGIMYIGNTVTKNEERPRPNITEITEY